MNVKRGLSKNIFLIIIILFLCILTSFYITAIIPNQKELETTNNQLSSIKTQINNYNQTLQNIIKKINLLNNQNKTQLRNPTYNEVLIFLLNDTTNENTYHDKDYNCVHFSTDVNNNAEEQGIRCAFVEIQFNYNYPHAIVAFNTTDKGIVFFEPQEDKIADIQLGKDYWGECLEDSTSHGAGSIITDYTLYW